MLLLVTGASGFIGEGLLKKLQLNCHEVVTIGRTDESTIKYDLTSPVITKQEVGIKGKPECIIHLAGVTPWATTINWNDDLRMAENIIELCRIMMPKKLIYVSGWNVYDMSNGKPPYGEDNKVGPADEYGKSKLKVEQALEEGLKNLSTRLIKVRLSSVYGPGQKSPGLITNLLSCAINNHEIYIESVRTKRDYIYIDDASVALAELAVGNHFPEIINIGSGKSYSVLAIAKILQQSYKEITGNLLTIRIADDASESLVQDNRLKIANALHMDLLKTMVSIENGMKENLTWRLENASFF